MIYFTELDFDEGTSDLITEATFGSMASNGCSVSFSILNIGTTYFDKFFSFQTSQAEVAGVIDLFKAFNAGLFGFKLSEKLSIADVKFVYTRLESVNFRVLGVKFT